MKHSHHKVIRHNTFDDSLTQYGDGVFETMLGIGDTIHHWHYHWQRLQSSCRRLAITLPEHDTLYQQLQAALAEHKTAFSVVKMIVSRGAGLRGYRSHRQQPCYVQFSVSDFQPNVNRENGLSLRICQTRLASQPLLAGMKHLNRLEYVMARREPTDKQFDEGLLLNYDSRLIEGLISNVFIMNKQHITTPSLDTAGVAGTMRAFLLEHLPNNGYSVAVSSLSLSDIAQAEAVFVSNATHGVQPVRCIQGIDKKFDITAVNAIRQLTEHPGTW